MSDTHDDFQSKLLATLQTVEAMDKAASDVKKEITETDDCSVLDGIEAEMPNVELAELESKLGDEDESDIQTDYKRARNFTYALQEISLTMMRNACKLAVGTQHPKAYDTFNNLLTNMRGLNKDLLEINKAANEVRKTNRELPPKDRPVNGDGGTDVTVTADGQTVAVSITKRPTTQSILEIIKAAKESGELLDNDEIAKRALQKEAEESQEAEFSEIEEPENVDLELEEPEV